MCLRVHDVTYSVKVMSRAQWSMRVAGQEVASILQVRIPNGNISFGVLIADFCQYPLELAWALSIHKSQGMSLDKAEINLSRVFEFGQAYVSFVFFSIFLFSNDRAALACRYVALSRVRSLEGLSLIGSFSSSVIRAHPNVISFYNSSQFRQGDSSR